MTTLARRTQVGRRRRGLGGVLAGVLAVTAITTVGALGLRPGSVAHAAASPGSVYTPVTPTRLADTRRVFGTAPAGRPAAEAVRRVQITGRPEVTVPTAAVAVVLNVTAVGAEGDGYVTVYPAGAAVPNASNLNTAGVGYVGANLVTVRLGQGGAVELYTSVGTDLLVDVAGYYAPVAGAVAAGRTVPAGPTRAYDTRSLGTPFAAGEWRTVTLGAVPAGARAAVLNATVTETTGAGFWSVVPPGAPRDASGAPTTSSLNVGGAGATVASQVIVPIGDDRRVEVFTSGGGQFVLDLFGYVTGPASGSSTDGLFVALDTPFRAVDTRTGNSPIGAGHRMWPGWELEATVAGRGGVPTTGVAAVVGNLTSVDPHAWGWVAAFPAGTVFPGTSSVNTDRAGSIVPNHLLTPVSPRGVSLVASAGGHLLLDVAGWFTGNPTTPSEPAPVNAMPLPVYPLRIQLPSIGIDAALQGDSLEADLVHGPGWWPGTGYLGVDGNMAVFGHRTEHGGPFRDIDRLRDGDRVTVSGDHRRAVYEVVARTVVPAERVEDYLGPFAGSMLTLIACSRADGSATSLRYRIIVTATLVSYRDD